MSFKLGHQLFSFLQTLPEACVLPGYHACQPSDRNYTIGSPESPACPLTLQIWGLASLYVCTKHIHRWTDTHTHRDKQKTGPNL